MTTRRHHCHAAIKGRTRCVGLNAWNNCGWCRHTKHTVFRCPVCKLEMVASPITRCAGCVQLGAVT